jgi:RNA-binding protein YlmH
MNIYQHFRAEEHAFIDHVLEWKESVISTYSPRLTDFLDPREQQIVRSMMGQDSDVIASFFGGSSSVERKRALLYPSYFVPEDSDFALKLFEIQYPQKFVTIEHPQVLGSLMSLGLKRSKYGDILVKDDTIQIVVAKEIAEYLIMNLQSIGRAKISLEQKSLSSIITPAEEWREQACTVSSMRLDVIIAEAFNLSRSKSSPLIKGGIVKVNWKQVEETSFECQEGDIISVRGHGRCKIDSIEGKTKRDKWKIKINRSK